MPSFNRVFMMGNLTRDPLLRHLSDHLAVAEFGLACTEYFGGRNGERKERTCFVDIVAWDRQAATCAEHLRKGMPVFVEGKLQLDEWTDKQSGEKRTKLRIRADRVHFIGAPRPAAGGEARQSDEDDSPAPEPAERQPPPPAATRGRAQGRAAAA